VGKKKQNSCTIICKVGILVRVIVHSRTHFDVASQLFLSRSMLSVLEKKYGNIPKIMSCVGLPPSVEINEFQATFLCVAL
jgi:hypothetical protein